MEEWKRYLWQDCDGNYSQAICGWHDQLIELGIVNELTEAENKKFWAEVSVEEEKSDRRRFLRPIL
jgi:hypothetical protein